MNSEALRLLEKIKSAIAAFNNTRPYTDYHMALAAIQMDIAALRALLSAQEPTAEHWRQAIHDWYGAIQVGLAWDWIEKRARELAKQEAK